jgi:ubiquinone/menaquinone biosynthesis C-methylase UbiE
MNPMARHKVRLPGLLLAALVFSVLPALGQAASTNPNPWDWPERDKWQHPEEVMSALRLRPGSAVADVGCGRGYFTYHLADRVGPQGEVYAVDIEHELIDGIRHQALSKWLVQVKAVLGTPDDPHLPAHALDAILVVHAYHEMHDYDAMLERFYRALKPGGLLGIIEFNIRNHQPRSAYFEQHQIPPQIVRDEVTHHHFRFLQNEPGFSIPGSSSRGDQYFLLFEKPQD